MQWHLPTSCATDKQPDAHLKFKCNFLHSNVDFNFDMYTKNKKKNKKNWQP